MRKSLKKRLNSMHGKLVSLSYYLFDESDYCDEHCLDNLASDLSSLSYDLMKIENDYMHLFEEAKE